MAQFIENAGSFELEYDHQTFPGFLLVNLGSTANATHIKFRQFTGIADQFPPLPDNSLAYRTPSVNLAGYMTPLAKNNIIDDHVKQIIWDLGQIALHCSNCDMKLDMDTKNIYVADDVFPRVKGIVIPGHAGSNWMVDLANVYKEIEKACCTKTGSHLEFANFIKQVENSGSHSKFKRLSIIRKFGEFVDIKPTVFHRVYPSPILLQWRDKMLQDPKIKGLVAGIGKEREGQFDFEAKEVDFLLCFLKSTVAHFRKMCKHLFADEFEMLEYYESTFQEIMNEVYLGSKRVEHVRGYEFRF